MIGGLRQFIGRVRPGYEQPDVLPDVPAGYVDSFAAAELLGLDPRSARDVMTKAGVKPVRVRNERRKYWPKESVIQLLKRRGGAPVELKDIPGWLCPAVEAMRILGLTRGGLARVEDRGRLASQKIKCVHKGRVKEFSFYERAKVVGLSRNMEEKERARKETNVAIAEMRFRELYEL